MEKEGDPVDRIRRFNRRYVPVMRLLDKGYLDTGMSALETAALIEIGESKGCSARDIASLLRVDKGYLSRTIGKFEQDGLVVRSVSPEDSRVRLLALTKEGRKVVDRLAENGSTVIREAFPNATEQQLTEIADALDQVLEALEGTVGGR